MFQIPSLITLILLFSATTTDAFKVFTKPAPPSAFKNYHRGSRTSLSFGGEEDATDLGNLNALTTTEKWLSSAVPDNMMRKEVSYVIENGSDPSSVISGIWNRLSQVKEQGEAYAEKAKNTQSSGPNGKPPPYRSTLVVVCPNCEEIGDFPLFDDVVETINESRRHARRFVVEDIADKMREAVSDVLPDANSELEWSTSVNLAHLHPKFDDRSPLEPKTKEEFEALSESEQEEARKAAAELEAARSRMTDEERSVKDENDKKIAQYRQKKIMARRSPHPTVVIEVRTAIRDWGAEVTEMMATPEQQQQQQQMEQMKKAKGEPDVDSLKNLEASFLKTATPKEAATSEPTVPTMTKESDGDTADESEIARTTLSPRLKVEQWLAKKSVEGKVKVKEFEGKNVDEAYGYLFSCMSKEITAINSSDPGDPTSLVFAMPRFLRSSATSFTRFATDVGKIVESVATPLNIDVDYYHPEGVDEEKRAPIGVIVFTITK